MKPFSPLASATVSIAAGSVSQSVALQAIPTGQAPLRIYNAGATTAFVNFGGSGVGAQTSVDLPVPSGVVEVLTLDNPQRSPVTHVAAVTTSGTTTLYFTPGQGL